MATYSMETSPLRTSTGNFTIICATNVASTEAPSQG